MGFQNDLSDGWYNLAAGTGAVVLVGAAALPKPAASTPFHTQEMTVVREAGRADVASSGELSVYAAFPSVSFRDNRGLTLDAPARERRPNTHMFSTEPDVALQEAFSALAERWRAETGDSSSIMRIVMHPAYQRIIGMGSAAIPLILDDLARTESHWFWALQSITGENPIPYDARGYVDRMTEAWLEWGRQHGINV